MSLQGLALLLAAALAIAVGCAHSYLGERYILVRLFRRPDLPKLFGGTEFTTRTLRLAWHLTTVAWFGAAGILFAMAQGPISSQLVGLIIAAVFFASALLTFGVSRGRHLAWLVFLLVSILTGYAVGV